MPSTPPAPVPVKPGYRSTEFYVTLITTLMPLVTFAFHRSLDRGSVQALATVAAGIATAGYALSRAIVKGGHARVASAASLQGQAAGPATPGLSDVVGRLDELLAAVQRMQPPAGQAAGTSSPR